MITIEEERKALSRELHDTVAQDLVAVKLQLSRVTMASEVADRVGADLDAALTQVRQLAVGLRPPTLDRIGLAASLRELCETTAKRGPMAVICDLPPMVAQSLDESTALQLYRIVQESLQNALRHSRGRSVKVTLRHPPGTLVLEIVDDGVGGEGAPARPGGTGLGLVGMRERASLVGGQLTVESSPGTGTRIHLEVPYESSDR